VSEDDFDQALKFEVLAASLRSDHKQSADMLEALAGMLEAALPESTTVVRKGMFLSKEKSVERATVKFEEYQYEIVKEKHGALKARAMKVVRGVVLKTSDIPFDKCIDNILTELEKLAANNAEARRALNKIMLDI
jgi:hypothetical protein